MGSTVRLPKPVYERVSDIARQEDVSRGTVVREWMHKARLWDEHGPTPPRAQAAADGQGDTPPAHDAASEGDS